MKKLKIEANLKKLDELIDYIKAGLAPYSISPALFNDVELAVEEVFNNIASYAYAPSNGTVDIYLSVDENKILIKFEDTGKPFNPLEQAGPDLHVPLMEREIGGLGIYFVKQIMDDITYSYIENKNVLTLTLKLRVEKGKC